MGMESAYVHVSHPVFLSAQSKITSEVYVTAYSQIQDVLILSGTFTELVSIWEHRHTDTGCHVIVDKHKCKATRT